MPIRIVCEDRKRILVIAAAVLLLAAGAAGAYLHFRGAGPWECIPRDVSVVGFVDMQHVLKIDSIAEAIRKAKAAAADQKDFLSRSGLDPEQWSRVYFGFDAASAVGGGAPAFVVLIETGATLDEAVIGKDLRAEPLFDGTTEMGGHTAYRMKSKGPGDPAGAVVVLDAHRLLAGTPELLRGVPALGGSGGGALQNEKVMALCDGGRRPEMAWVAGRLPESVRAQIPVGPRAAPGLDAAKSLETFAIFADYKNGAGLSAKATLKFASDAAAAKALGGLQMLKGMALMAGVPDDGVGIKQSAAEVAITLAVPDEVLKRASAPR